MTGPGARDGAPPGSPAPARARAKLDLAEVRRIARLAHLEYPRILGPGGQLGEPHEHLIDDRALEKLALDLAQILDHVEELDLVDTEGVEVMSHAVTLPGLLRRDEPGAVLGADVALSGAPGRIGDAVRVPKIVEP